MGVADVAPLVLNLGSRWTGQLHFPAALPGAKGPTVPIEQEAGWTPELIWTFLRREHLLEGYSLVRYEALLTGNLFLTLLEALLPQYLG
jgi:hypothetical protein